MTMLPTMLAGANYVMHAAGWLESGLVSCFEKFIVDVEILRMLEAEFTPLEIERGVARLLGARGGRRRRPLPRRRAHARALPRLLLPAAALVDLELRALAAGRRQGRGGAGDRDRDKRTLEEYVEPRARRRS